MRNWAKEFHLHLCIPHSNALWNERWIMYRAIIFNKKYWRNHPEVKQFENCPEVLWDLQMDLRIVRLNKGLKANIPTDLYPTTKGGIFVPYKTTLQQLDDLIAKQCNCDTEAIKFRLGL